MKKIALFFNHDQLGGAERSAIEQASNFEKNQIDVFVPRITSGKNEITKKLDFDAVDNIYYIDFPKSYSFLSRSSRNNYPRAIMGVFKMYYKLFKIDLRKYDVVWLNGLKIFVFIMPLLFMKRYKVWDIKVV